MYIAQETRYDKMQYRHCGASGLLLPAVSLGLWHNFGSNGNFDTMTDMCRTAFDCGITRCCGRKFWPYFKKDFSRLQRRINYLHKSGI